MHAKSSGLKYVGLVMLATFLLACGQKGANLQEDAVAPDKTLYDNGLKFLQKSQFIKSRLSLQTLINTYPDSEYTPSAYISIADSYYREGGTEAFLQAESQYKDFIIYFPTHELADDAKLRVCSVNFKLMKDPDRDSTYTKKARKCLQEFIREYPESELAPFAGEYLNVVEENQAAGVQVIGDFYFRKSSHLAAEGRYKEVLETFPDYSQLDVCHYRLAEVLLALGRTEEASVNLAQIRIGFPFSRYFDDAREKLILLEKPVPEIDEAEAARRRANLIEDSGGSMMNPINLVKNIFSGREDLYEAARRRAEARSFSNGETPAASKDGNNQ